MSILARYVRTLSATRYSHSRSISSTPHLRSLGWVDKIKSVFTGGGDKPAASSSPDSFSLNDFAEQMEKAKKFEVLKRFQVGRCNEATLPESFKKQATILRYLASCDPSGEKLTAVHKQNATVQCNCTLTDVENALSKYTWAKEAQKKVNKLKEEGRPLPTTLGEVQKLMGSTPLDVERSNLAKSGKLGRNSPCFCGSGKKYKRCCGPP